MRSLSGAPPLSSFAFASCSMNVFVPDFAIVPIFSTTSARDMPMPLSEIVSVLLFLSGTRKISYASFPSRMSLFVRLSKWSLSIASDAFEISSRRKISRFV